MKRLTEDGGCELVLSSFSSHLVSLQKKTGCVSDDVKREMEESLFGFSNDAKMTENDPRPK